MSAQLSHFRMLPLYNSSKWLSLVYISENVYNARNQKDSIIGMDLGLHPDAFYAMVTGPQE
jgi:hypothetical protein